VNRSDLIEDVSRRLEITRKDAERSVDAVVSAIQRGIERGDKVRVKGLGVFESVERAARTVRNPATGERISKEKTRLARFRPSTDLKQILAGARELPGEILSGDEQGARAAVRKMTGSAAPAAKAAPVAKATATRTTAKKATTAAAKAPAKKAPAKKATTTATKAPAKKATTTATKAPAKKAPAKKATTTAAKAPAKKAPAKKATTTATKAPAKKAPAKKATTAATKAPAKKAPADTPAASSDSSTS
jgi:DNA-binding protein HU-beta